METIKTIQGDTWDKISFRVYGSENFIDKLISSNLQHSKIFIFNSGEEINVPTIDIDASLISESLPIWKR